MALPYSYFTKTNFASPNQKSPAHGRASQPRTAAQRAQDKKAHGGSTVQQDRLWREFIEAEQRSTKRWKEHWSFLKDYDSLGNEKEEQPLPEYVSVFSDNIPNTTNQNIGSRLNTNIGKTLVQMDYFLTKRHQKRRLGDELSSF
ncbi:ciliary microtubule inner protein 5 isoform X2 [Microcaecilia unicolor]|uniref:Uncharacterized protein C2orf50 homolog isoform X2 n=1 Tax=Microcaecilia unicolor TaxID=1415580 RepID=A0A6P7X7B0_9AMPH|nr:uncharacterized protein C2orf50 homolog isoform X2 [Microcaecilia unicolor]